MNANRVQDEKYLIISLGPAGSGKSTITADMIRVLCKRRGLTDELERIMFTQSFKSALIDDYVESDELFIKESINATSTILQNSNIGKYIPELADKAAVIKYVDGITTLKTDGTINRDFCNTGPKDPSLSIYRDIEECAKIYSKIYMGARDRLSYIMDADMERWFSAGENIIFETTGMSDFSWIFQLRSFQESYVRDNYVVYLVYPYVDRKTILVRGLHRFALSVDSFIRFIAEHVDPHAEDQLAQRYQAMSDYCRFLASNAEVKAPRLVSLVCNPQGNVYDVVDRVQNNIAAYVADCVNGSPDPSHKNRLGSLLFYDNNDAPVSTSGRIQPLIVVNFSCDHTSVEYDETRCTSVEGFIAKYRDQLTPDFTSMLTHIRNTECSMVQTDKDPQAGGADYKYKYIKYKAKYLNECYS